jgi:hypothetical protein
MGIFTRGGKGGESYNMSQDHAGPDILAPGGRVGRISNFELGIANLSEGKDGWVEG